MWVVSYFDRDNGWRPSRRFPGQFETFDEARIAVLRRHRNYQGIHNRRYCVHVAGNRTFGYDITRGGQHPHYPGFVPRDIVNGYQAISTDENEALNWQLADEIEACRDRNAPDPFLFSTSFSASDPTPLTSLELPMPTMPDTSVPVETPTPAPNTANRAQFADIAIKRTPGDNRLVLSINAKPLHDLLDAIGVTHNEVQYQNRPPANFQIVNGTTLSTELFLKRQYPVQVNLTGVFTQPPTMERLRNVCESGYEVIRTILNHYQPIDISVSIHKKLAG